MDQIKTFHAIGKRKTSIANVIIKKGQGKFSVNKRELMDYFPNELLRMKVNTPFSVTNLSNQFDVDVKVKGGGLSGQAHAILHGISKALLLYNAELRKVLKKEGFLTRDSRIKERKKYGQRGARARYQYSKR